MCHTQRSLGVLSCWLRQGKGTLGGKGDFSAPQGDSDPQQEALPLLAREGKGKVCSCKAAERGGNPNPWSPRPQRITRSSEHQKHHMLHTPPARSPLKVTAARAQPHPKAQTPGMGTLP